MSIKSQYIYLLAAAAFCLQFSSCIQVQNRYEGLPPGTWRATLDLSSSQSVTDPAFDEQTDGFLPFNFEVIYTARDSFHIEIINGEERIVIDEIAFGFDKTVLKDTVRIEFPGYGTYISARYEEDAIEGHWYAPDRGADYHIPFKALHGKTQRFMMIEDPDMDITGKWAVTFKPDQPDAYEAIGVFKQEDDGHLTGTFLTNTGDYRFLDGKVSANRVYLSTFDGAHAYLFEAKYLADGSLTGTYRSGNHYKVYWSATRQDTASLADPYALSIVTDASTPIEFTFPDINGDSVSLSDPQFAGKPKIIQITGSWCPNCRDETAFLVDYLNEHPDLNIEVIAVAFERHRERDKALAAVRRYKEFFDLPYPILYGGINSKEEASRHFPMLNRIAAFPTLIFLDADNRVVRIHSGFSGPATEQYPKFKEEFDGIVTEIQNL